MIAPTRIGYWLLTGEGLQRLVDAVKEAGFEVRGPRVVDGSLKFGRIESIDDLPSGWEDEQSPGGYRLRKTGRRTRFGVVHGATSPKSHFFPPRVHLWRSKRVGSTFELIPTVPDAPKTALWGIRPCDLKAIEIQDEVFLNPEYPDPVYRARRANTLLIVANCTRVQPTCFCTHMGGSVAARSGFDIALTELEGAEPRYLAESGSETGTRILESCRFEPAGREDLSDANRLFQEAESQIRKGIETDGLKDLLYRNAENPRWQNVGERCFACANCTQVCPTCFCHTPEDSCSIDQAEASRQRVWDSCFSEEFSYIHGGSIRRSFASRYRQWMTHKLAAWQDQFGTSGCVGCGRCIAWCPARIDLRDEAEAIRRSDLINVKE